MYQERDFNSISEAGANNGNDTPTGLMLKKALWASYLSSIFGIYDAFSNLPFLANSLLLHRKGKVHSDLKDISASQI